jgi:HlyD family secretion protein
MLAALHKNEDKLRRVPGKPSSMDRPVSPRRFTLRYLWITVAAALVVCLLSVAYVRYGRADTLVVSRERLQFAAVEQGMFREFIPLTGNVLPGNTVYLDAVDGGQVTDVFAEEGAQVKAGQPLLKLNNSEKLLEVMRVEAELTAQLNQLSTAKLEFAQASLQHDRDLIDAQTQLEQLQRQQTRRVQLRDSGVVARSDLEDGELQLKHAQQLLAALKKAQALDGELQSKQIVRIEQAVAAQSANLNIAHRMIGNLNIAAPIAGQLTALNAHVGESKGMGQRIGQIDQLDSNKVSALVDEFYLARIATGQAADADLDTRSYRLQLTKVYPEVRERQFKIDLRFVAAPPASLRVGQSLQLRLDIGGSSKALIVANGPFYENSSQGVYVLDSSGKLATRRKVQFGRHTTDTVEVLSGLVKGERIVTSSYESYAGIERLRML